MEVNIKKVHEEELTMQLKARGAEECRLSGGLLGVLVNVCS